MSDITRRTFVGAAAATGAAVALSGTPALAAEAGAQPADGEYTTSCRGRNGMVTCVTTIADGAIADVECIEQQETPVFTAEAIPLLCTEIAAANSFGVDSITGATWSSAAIKTCVRQAIVDAGGDPDAFDVPTDHADAADQTIDCDVAIVGAGFSGIFAAARAAQEGAKVCLIDKSIVGGCSLQSFAVTVYDGEEVVREKLNSWIAEQMYLVDPALIYAYLANNKPMIDWVETFQDSTEFFPYGFDFFGAPMGMFCDYMLRPPFYADMLEKTVIAGGGCVMTGVAAHELIKDGDAVTGVVATAKDGSTVTINAKATILATGGFGGDSARLKELTGYDVVCGCLTQCVGEGMEMAWAAGAKKPVSLGGMMLHQTLAESAVVGYEYFQQQMPMILGYVPSVLDLDAAGRRFRNEDWVNVATAASNGGAFAGGKTYVLLDADMIGKLMEGGTAAIGFMESPGMPPEYKPDFQPDTPWDGFDAVLEDVVAGGWGFKGETLDGLAEAAGMDPAVLAATVEQYNAYCAAGKDDFFNKAPEHLVGYGEGPFYLVTITYNQLGTIGGIVVNDKFQVLDEGNRAIAGLYSTGADAYGTCWNRNYYGSGDGVGFAMVSGYVAGPIAAAYALGA